MNDKTAHKKLKEINERRNTDGVGRYKNSRRERNERHEKFSEALNDMDAVNDKYVE